MGSQGRSFGGLGGAGAPGSGTGCEYVYIRGLFSSMHDGFQSDTKGTVGCVFVAPPQEDSEVTIVAGNPKFAKNGDLQMAPDDELIFESHYDIKGHSSLTGRFTTTISTSDWFADEFTSKIEVLFQIKTDDWNGTWLDVRDPDNLTQFTDLEGGFRWKLKLKNVTADTTVKLMSFVLLETNTSLQTQQDNLYVVDPTNLTLQNVEPGTKVKIYSSDLSTKIAEVAATTDREVVIAYRGAHEDAILILHNLNYLYQKTVIQLTGEDMEIPISQTPDPTYKDI